MSIVHAIAAHATAGQATAAEHVSGQQHVGFGEVWIPEVLGDTYQELS